MNKWLSRLNGGQQVQQPINPAMQQAQIIAKALQDPAAFVREQFPDIPENIRNNPNAVLQYLCQTRGNGFVQALQQVSGMYGGR